MHSVAALTIGVALFAVGLARYAVSAVGSAVDAWGADVEITAYLKDEVGSEQAATLAEQLRKELKAEVRLVSAEEALSRLARELGESGQVLTRLPKNPLPVSIEVQPAAQQRSADAVAALAGAIAKRPEVEAVEYGRDWLERLQRVSVAVRGAGALVLLLVLIAAVVVVSATLQLAIYARREEIEIQELVGATDSFVKAPFLIEGVFQGLFGGALACLGLFGLSAYVGPRIGDAFRFLTAGLPLPSLLDARGLVEIATAGMALGLLGSLIAVRRYSKL